MSTPVQSMPDDEEEDVNNENDNLVVVTNISSLPNLNNIDSIAPPRHNEELDGVHQLVPDETLSLSSRTSATSIASALSDGNSRLGSASVGIGTDNGLLPLLPGQLPSSRPNSTPRQRSTTPRSRPRSNPRTRTPMRRESPLLITGRVDRDGGDGSGLNAISIASNTNSVEMFTPSALPSPNADAGREGNAAANGGNEGSTADNSEVRNIFNTRRRNRAGSIPEEDDEEEAQVISAVDARSSPINETSSATNAPASTSTTDPTPRRAGHWLAQAGAAITRSTRSANPARSSNPIRSRLGQSDKQNPSHRKLRRWNNDRFVGTPSEHTHIALESKMESMGEGGEYWEEHYMPHYPLEYRSEFAKLVNDESKTGKGARERFVRGEVANSTVYRKGKGMKGRDGSLMERSVAAKFQKMGITDSSNTGEKLFQSIAPRIQSVVSRSCASHGDDGITFASQVVSAFESYIVSLALAASKKEAVSSSLGYPPQQSEDVYNLFDKMLVRPPKIVLRSKHKMHHRSSTSVHAHDTTKHEHAVLVPTVHFYFSAADTQNNDAGKDNNERSNSTAFYRILLYAVCQFHGLESSSTIMSPPKKNWGQKRKHKKRLSKGSGSDKRRTKEQDVVKVVTVQSGILLAPALKLLDYAVE